MIVHSAKGKPVKVIAEAMGCGTATVTRARQRWREQGEAGLIDRREDNQSQAKVTDDYLSTLHWVLQYRACDFAHRRPTWTLKLLRQTLYEHTGITLSPSQLSRWLHAIGARCGRPKPTVQCPWSDKDKRHRVQMIHGLIESLPEDEAAVWEDEVDIELNPRIGTDWMLPGQQREVETPGKNQKRYIAGAMDAQTDRVYWIHSARKNSRLFIDHLKQLLRAYPDKRVIHVILDNYRIHSSRQTQAWLAEYGKRLRLHFLPPYCPDENRIERRLWRELHRNVTYNHQCQTLDELIAEVREYLRRHNLRVAWQEKSDRRKVI